MVRCGDVNGLDLGVLNAVAVAGMDGAFESIGSLTRTAADGHDRVASFGESRGQFCSNNLPVTQDTKFH